MVLALFFLPHFLGIFTRAVIAEHVKSAPVVAHVCRFFIFFAEVVDTLSHGFTPGAAASMAASLLGNHLLLATPHCESVIKAPHCLQAM